MDDLNFQIRFSTSVIKFYNYKNGKIKMFSVFCVNLEINIPIF